MCCFMIRVSLPAIAVTAVAAIAACGFIINAAYAVLIIAADNVVLGSGQLTLKFKSKKSA